MLEVERFACLRLGVARTPALEQCLGEQESRVGTVRIRVQRVLELDDRRV